MLEIYRSSSQGSSGFDRYKELCRGCAKQEIDSGHYVEYDLYSSERTDSVSKDDECELCGSSFFRDGRKKFKKIDKVVY